MTKSIANNNAAIVIDSNSSAAIDLTNIEFNKLGRREKGSDVLEFFAEKVLKKAPDAIEMVAVKGSPNLVFTKLNNRVRIHMIKQNGLNVSTVEVKGPELKALREVAAPEAFAVKAKKSTKREDRSIYDEEGNVLRQAPIGKTTPEYVHQLEVLANEFTTMDPNANFGIHFRVAMSKGTPKHIMMTVYTAGPEKAKAASPKGVKINFLGNADMLDEWLEKVQSVYDDCAQRLLNVPIVHEMGFKFDRKSFVEKGELVILDMKKVTLDEEALNKLRQIVK